MKIANFLENKRKTNKIEKKLKPILHYIINVVLAILVIYNILYTFNNVFFEKHYVQIFGIYIVTPEKEETMKPSINKNDLIISYKLKRKDIKENDIIGYDINNHLTFHRLSIIKQVDGKEYFITKGDNNYHYDIEEKTEEEIKAKILIKIPIIGWIFRIFESKIMTVIIILIFSLKYSYNKYKMNLSKLRKEKRDEKRQ